MKKAGKVVNLEVVVNNKEENIMNENEQAATTETITMPNETEAVDTTKNEDGEYDVAELVKTGPRGVTNQGMIPALKEYIAKGETAKITTLRKCFPDVVQSTLKYLGKKEVKKFNELVG